MNAVQDRASLHEKAVQKVARDEVTIPRQRRAEVRPRSSRVTRSRMHPALKMAHDLGIDPARIEITADAPLWGCVVHNHPVRRLNRKRDG